VVVSSKNRKIAEKKFSKDYFWGKKVFLTLFHADCSAFFMLMVIMAIQVILHDERARESWSEGKLEREKIGAEERMDPCIIDAC